MDIKLILCIFHILKFFFCFRLCKNKPFYYFPCESYLIAEMTRIRNIFQFLKNKSRGLMLLKSNTVPLALCSLRRSINRQRHRRENIAKYNTFTVYSRGDPLLPSKPRKPRKRRSCVTAGAARQRPPAQLKGCKCRALANI